MLRYVQQKIDKLARRGLLHEIRDILGIERLM